MSTGQAWWRDKENEWCEYDKLCRAFGVKAMPFRPLDWEDHFVTLLEYKSKAPEAPKESQP